MLAASPECSPVEPPDTDPPHTPASALVDLAKDRDATITLAIDALHRSYQRSLREQRMQYEHDVAGLQRSLGEATDAVNSHRTDTEHNMHRLYTAHDAAVAERYEALRERNRAVRAKSEAIADRDAMAADRAEAHRRLQTIMAESLKLSKERDFLLVDRNQAVQEQAELRRAKERAEAEREAAVTSREEERLRVDSLVQQVDTFNSQKQELLAKFNSRDVLLQKHLIKARMERDAMERKALAAEAALSQANADGGQSSVGTKDVEEQSHRSIRVPEAVKEDVGKTNATDSPTDVERLQPQSNLETSGNILDAEADDHGAQRFLLSGTASHSPVAELAVLKKKLQDALTTADTFKVEIVGLKSSNVALEAGRAEDQKRLEALIRERDGLVRDIATAKIELDRRSQSADTTAKDLADLRTTHALLEQARKTAEDQLEKAKQEREAVIAKGTSLQSELDRIARSLDIAQNDLMALQHTQDSAREERRALQEKLAAAVQERDALSADLITARADLDEKIRAAQVVSSELAGLQTAHASLQTERQKWEEQRVSLVEERATAMADLRRTQNRARESDERASLATQNNEKLRAIKDGILAERNHLILELQSNSAAAAKAVDILKKYDGKIKELEELRVEKQEILAAKLLYEEVSRREIDALTAELQRAASAEILRAAEYARDAALVQRDKEVEKRNKAELSLRESEGRVKQLEQDARALSSPVIGAHESGPDGAADIMSHTGQRDDQATPDTDTVMIKELKITIKQLRLKIRGLSSANATLRESQSSHITTPPPSSSTSAFCHSDTCASLAQRAADLEGQITSMRGRLNDMIQIGIQPRLEANGMISNYVASPAMAPYLVNAMPPGAFMAARHSARVRQMGSTASSPVIAGPSRLMHRPPVHRTRRSDQLAASRPIRNSTSSSPRSALDSMPAGTTTSVPARYTRRHRKALRGVSMDDTESDGSAPSAPDEDTLNASELPDGSASDHAAAAPANPRRSTLVDNSAAASSEPVVPISTPDPADGGEGTPGKATSGGTADRGVTPFRLPRLGVFEGARTEKQSDPATTEL